MRLVPKAEELGVPSPVPGEVLALTGKGMWVQCGEGQLQILDSTLEDLPGKTPGDLVARIGGERRLLVG